MLHMQTAHSLAALGVAGAFLFLAFLGLTVRASGLRRSPLWVAVVAGLLAGPLVAWGFAFLAATKPDPAVKARGGGLFTAGPDGVFSVLGAVAALVIGLISIVGAYLLGRFGLDMRGEPLQQPVIVALILGGFAGGFVLAWSARRVGFLEILFVTGLMSLVPVGFSDFVSDLFTYGTAAAYYGVVMLAGALIFCLALTLGGSIGFLVTGDGKPSLDWAYEGWIGRRFLMGKGSNNVVGIITVISVIAVAAGTMAMIVVMSVMNGFSTDLRSKIFGANAHLIVLKYGTDFTEYSDIASRTRPLRGVTGASPFVLNEVMVSSDVNLTGALLKGIENDSVDQVSVLRSNVEEGDLTWLKTPEKIPVPDDHKKGERNAPQGALRAPGAEGQAEGDRPPSSTGPEMGVGPGTDEAFDDADDADDDDEDDVNADGQPDTTSELAALQAAMAAATAGTPAETAANQGPTLPGIAIGKEMSRNLKVFVGDVVNVVSPIGELGPTGPVPKARAFRVASIFYSGMYEYDSKFIYIDLEQAQDFFSLDGAVTGIEYKVDDIDATQGIARDILKEIGGYPYRTKDWMEMNKNLFSALKLEKVAMFLILTLIILVASLLIAATLIVFVIEKSKEVAILKSMGATDTSIMKVFITYGVIIGAVGAFVGATLGLGICWAVKTFGIGLDPDVYYITNLPVHVDYFEVSLVLVAAVLLSYLATIYPSLIAARMRPVEGLRFE
jgi:ABC-type lipoprotein release transport system permease subunit